MTCHRCGAEFAASHQPGRVAWCPACVAKVCCTRHAQGRAFCPHRPARNAFARSALAAAALLLAGCSSGDAQTAAYHRDEVVRAEAGREYRLRIEADDATGSFGRLDATLRAIRPPRPAARARSRVVHASRSGRRPCPQRSLAQIGQDESGGDYGAVNQQGSSASGKYQVLDRTWDGYAGYGRAKDAPPEVQERWAREAYAKSGSKPWRASGC